MATNLIEASVTVPGDTVTRTFGDHLKARFQRPAYETRALAAAANIPAYVNAVETLGYYSAGDQKGGVYKRVAAAPYHQLYFQSADGAYWEYVPGPEGINAGVAGLVGDGVTDDWMAFMKVTKFLKLYGRSRKYTVTISIASPAVITSAAHGFQANDAVWFTTTGALPTGIIAGRPYFIRGTGLTVDSFQISERQAYRGGDPFESPPGDGEFAAVNTSGSQSGTHSVQLSGVDPMVLIIPPGIYETAQNFYLAGFAHVRQLHVKAYGAQFITTGSGGSSSGFNIGGAGLSHPNMTSTSYSTAFAKIATTSIDPGFTNTVTLVTAGEISRFMVNQWVHVSAIDLQNAFGSQTSWPPNNQIQEFKRIRSISGATITFETPLKQKYSSHYPEFFAGNASSPSGGGPAMIRGMEPAWDIDIIFEGGHFMSNVAGGQQIGSCRKYTIRNCVFEAMDFLPQASFNKEVAYENCEFRSANTQLRNQSIEIDKAVEIVRFTGCTMGIINQQSGSIKRMIIESCDIHWVHGTARNTVIRDSTVGNLWIGPNSLGGMESLTVENSIVSYIQSDGSATTYQGPNSYRGLVELFTFANGILKIPIAWDRVQSWAVPGRHCYVTRIGADPGDGLSIDSMGSPFTIYDVWLDGSDFAIQTDLPAKPIGPSTNAPVTISIASPAVISWASHGLIANTPIVFKTTGVLPSGITNVLNGFDGSATYYVIAAGLTANAFQISSSIGGAAINTSGSQSGVHTAVANPLTFVPVMMPNLTFRNVTGSARAVELSRAPPGLPMNSYTYRRLSGDQGTAAWQYVFPALPKGKVVKIVIDVRRIYTGGNGAFTAVTFVFEASYNSDLTRNNLTLVINPRIAGKRIITPDEVIGAQSGDTIATTSVWLGRGIRWSYNSSAGNPDVAPVIDLEIFTDQGCNQSVDIFSVWRPGGSNFEGIANLTPTIY